MHTSKKSLLALSLLGPLAMLAAGCGGMVSTASNPGTTSSTPSQTLVAGGVAIASPANGASVSSPFTLAASAAACSSQPVASMSYAVDAGAAVSVNGTSISAPVTAAAGSHTVKVTAQGDDGAICNASVAVTVPATATPTSPTPPTSPAPSSPASPVPANAVVDSNIQTLTTWEDNHDPGAGASSSGSMFMVSSPSLSGDAREFDTTFSGSSGEIYHVSFGDNTTSTNFFYDAEVYLTSSASTIANLEMDMNQVMANGDTVIYGFQCDGYSGTWDYAENDGGAHWVHSSAACDVRKWSHETWHHIQISYSRDDSGNVTYHAVWLDGVESKINATVPSSFALGWAPELLTNFQIDGLGSGSNIVYLDKLTISRW